MLNNNVSLAEMKDQTTKFRKLETLKRTIAKLTCTDSWEEALSKFPNYTVEDRLAAFHQLNFKGGIPGVFKDYCSKEISSTMEKAKDTNTLVTFSRAGTSAYIMEGSFMTITGQSISETLHTNTGYSLIFASPPKV